MTRVGYGALLVLVIALLAGCETTKGVGRDITNTGENVEDVID